MKFLQLRSGGQRLLVNAAKVKTIDVYLGTGGGSIINFGFGENEYIKVENSIDEILHLINKK